MSGKKIEKWQRELLPLMTNMLVALTVVFFLASCLQLIYLHRTIQNGPKIDARDSLARFIKTATSRSFYAI
jgi:hypothetical protein